MQIGTVIALPIAAAGSDTSELPGSSAVSIFALLLLFATALLLIWQFRVLSGASPLKVWALAVTLIGVFCVMWGCVYLHLTFQRSILTEIKVAEIEAGQLKDLKPVLMQEVKIEISFRNLIRIVSTARDGLAWEAEVMEKSIRSREAVRESNKILESEWLSIAAILKGRHEYCVMSEEMAGRSEPEQVGAKIHEIQTAIAAVLYPEIYRRQVAKDMMSDGGSYPAEGEIAPEIMWERRGKTVDLIEKRYLKELDDLRVELEKKLDEHLSPPVDKSVNNVK